MLNKNQLWGKMRRLAITLPAALLAALLVVQPVLAAAPAAKPASALDIGCEDGICRFELDLGTAVNNLLPPSAQFLLQVVQDGLVQLPNGMSVQVRDNVVLTLPMGTLVLPDADLTLEFGPDRRIVAIHGTALTPVPTFGLLDGLQWITPARVDVGFEPGSALTDVQVPLDPDRRYFRMTMEAGLSALSRGDGPGLALEVPSGQRVTLLIDMLQPLLYVNGQVNLRYTGGLAFMREMVDPVGALAWWPTGLALPQTIEVGVIGMVGQGVSPNLELKAGYRVEPGMIGQWFHLDGALVEAEGSIVLGPDGLLLAGKAHSALAPEALADGEAMAQLYIPFDPAQPAADAPVAAVAPEPEPNLGVEPVAATVTLADEPARPDRLTRLVESSRQGLITGANVVADNARLGYGAVVQGADAGADWIGTAVAGRAHAINDQWCAVTNRCEQTVAEAQDPGRVAAAVHD